MRKSRFTEEQMVKIPEKALHLICPGVVEGVAQSPPNSAQVTQPIPLESGAARDAMTHEPSG